MHDEDGIIIGSNLLGCYGGRLATGWAAGA